MCMHVCQLGPNSPAKSCDKSLEELEDEWDMGEEGDDAGVDVGHGSLLLSRTKNRPLRYCCKIGREPARWKEGFWWRKPWLELKWWRWWIQE